MNCAKEFVRSIAANPAMLEKPFHAETKAMDGNERTEKSGGNGANKNEDIIWASRETAR